MGNQFGPVHLSGQFGNIRMVVDRGKGRAHMSRTVTKEQIMTEDAFLPTRENMSEFKGAGFASKSLRKCLGTAAQGFGERFLGARLNGLARKIISRGTGVGGERAFEVGPNVSLLYGFDLNRAEPFDGRFLANYTLTVNADRNTVQLDVPSLDCRRELRRPQGTNHFRFFLTVGLLSDMLYSAADNRHVPVDAVLNGLHGNATTLVLPTGGAGAPTSLQLTASIPGLPVAPAGVTLVVGVGIEFFRQIGGANTLLGSGNAMKIDSAYS